MDYSKQQSLHLGNILHFWMKQSDVWRGRGLMIVNICCVLSLIPFSTACSTRTKTSCKGNKALFFNRSNTSVFCYWANQSSKILIQTIFINFGINKTLNITRKLFVKYMNLLSVLKAQRYLDKIVTFSGETLQLMYLPCITNRGWIKVLLILFLVCAYVFSFVIVSHVVHVTVIH